MVVTLASDSSLLMLLLRQRWPLRCVDDLVLHSSTSFELIDLIRSLNQRQPLRYVDGCIHAPICVDLVHAG
jgi:hypothetical protein